MSWFRKAEPNRVRQELLQACNQIANEGGVVLFGRDGQPFAFYAQDASFLARDPGARERLRELVNKYGRRFEEGRAEAIRTAKAGLGGEAIR